MCKQKPPFGQIKVRLEINYKENKQKYKLTNLHGQVTKTQICLKNVDKWFWNISLFIKRK